MAVLTIPPTALVGLREGDRLSTQRLLGEEMSKFQATNCVRRISLVLLYPQPFQRPAIRVPSYSLVAKRRISR